MTHHCNTACEEPHNRHDSACTCEDCHQAHRDEGMQGWDGGLDCCTEEITFCVEKGLWCRKHRRPFIDLGNTVCSECEKEGQR